MPTIEELISNLEELKSTIQNSVDNTMLNEENGIVDINREQLLSGLDANGQQLGEYKPLSKKIRSEAGLQTDFIDLRFTGATQDSMFVSKLNDSTFELSTRIEENWEKGKNKGRFDAIGISESNHQQVTDIIVFNVEAVLNEKFA
jgi:hypothetical protein